MRRELIATGLQAAGVLAGVVAGFLVSVVVGFSVLGAGLLAFGLAVERRR